MKRRKDICPLPPLPAPESASVPAPSLHSFRRELPDFSSRHKVHHRLITLVYGKAQRSARVGICPLSSPSPFPPPSIVFSAGLSTCCSGGRGVPGPPSCLRRRTTSICRPLDGRTVFGRLQWVHARTLVCRTWRPAISRLSLG
jgi:hypothetical protein